VSFRASVLAAALLVTACHTAPPKDGLISLPGDAIVDGSAERRDLNGKVYDQIVERVEGHFYDRTFNGVDFQFEAAARREAIINQPGEEAFYLSVNVLLDLLDDGHTRAVRPQRSVYRRVATPSAVTFGLWTVADLEAEDGRYWSYVHSVRADGPAANLGIERGWRILDVEGRPWGSTAGLIENESYEIRFVDGDGEIQARSIPFTALPKELGSMVRRPDGVAVITLREFEGETVQWLDARLAELQANPPKAVVVDLRFTPGGVAASLPGVLGGFLTERVRYGRLRIDPFSRLVQTVMGTAIPEHVDPSPFAWSGPLAILQSSRSASAAELFAAAVQECRRGPIVGETSRGMVVLALGWALPDGGIVTVGAREFLTGDGVRLEKTGVIPDVEVVRTRESLRSREDTMLDAAAHAALLAPPGGGCKRGDGSAQGPF